MLQALIWDVDGTLAETELQGHRVAFNEAFAAAGLPWRWDEALYRELLAVPGGKERLRHYLERHRPPLPPRWRELAAREALVQRLHRDKNRRYAALVAAGRIPLRPGVRRLLAEARRAGLRQAVATTTSPENVSALLRRLLG
ncbi:MAG: HAD family hydrolase, partial [Gammaproteobacteria bacterium]